MCGRPVRGLPASRWLRPSSSSICAASICRGAAAALRCKLDACGAAESLSTQGVKHLQLLLCSGSAIGAQRCRVWTQSRL